MFLLILYDICLRNLSSREESWLLWLWYVRSLVCIERILHTFHLSPWDRLKKGVRRDLLRAKLLLGGKMLMRNLLCDGPMLLRRVSLLRRRGRSRTSHIEGWSC